jgi:DNA-binding HxlR family transcriptional regulator
MPRYLSVRERSAYHRLEDVVGCKWSAAVVAALSDGVVRPGALERYVPGISTKILNERLRKLIDYELVVRTEYPGPVRHVEYRLTPTGEKLAEVVTRLRELGHEHAAQRAKTEEPS